MKSPSPSSRAGDTTVHSFFLCCGDTTVHSVSLRKSKYNSRLIARLHGNFAYVEEEDMKK